MANLLDAIAKYVSPPGPKGPTGSPNYKTKDILTQIYSTDFSNWLKSTPYAFEAKIDDGKPKIFYLPISPQNLVISTYFATNTIATLYGTIEEHSEQRYFDISIQGTTGFSPAFYNIDQQIPSAGRESFASTAVIRSDLFGGFASGLIGKLNKVAKQATDIYGAVAGNTGPAKSGVTASRSGYAAFHNLYRFLLAHKQYASGGNLSANVKSESLDSFSTTPTPLYFLNFKDNNKYSCVVQRFSLERSADKPMLYNYNIQLRAYNLSSITNKPTLYNKARLQALGLDGSTASIASSFKGAVSNSKGLLNTLKNIRGT